MDRSYWWRKMPDASDITGTIVDGLAFLCILLPILSILGPIFLGVFYIDKRFEQWSKNRQSTRWEKMRLKSEIGAIENENRLRREA